MKWRKSLCSVGQEKYIWKQDDIHSEECSVEFTQKHSTAGSALTMVEMSARGEFNDKQNVITYY